MSRLNDFANSMESFAKSEDFNFVYWFSYAMLLVCIAGLVPLIVIPPVGIILLAIVVAPLVAYGAIWAVVGVAKLLNYIDQTVKGFSVFKDSDDSDAVIEVTPDVAPQYQQAPQASAEFNASASQYDNPLSAASYVRDVQPVQYDLRSSLYR